MPYPIVADADARKLHKAWLDGADEEALLLALEEHVAPDGDDISWGAIVSSMIEDLEALYKRVDGRNDKRLSNDRFEAMACTIIHKALPADDALADPEFWIWMSTIPGRNLIKRRYSRFKDGHEILPDRLNFTSTSARETFFYRLWIRAELAYDPERLDAYELAGYGDIDFWRSHVNRQMMSETGSLLKAFIEFQHPNGPTGEKRLPDKDDIRRLVKLMRRAAANVMVEALDDDSAKRFVEEQWQKMQTSK